MGDNMKVDNTTMRVLLETVDSIIGENGLNSVLNYSNMQSYIGNFPPLDDGLDVPIEDFHRIRKGLRDVFGDKGSRVLLRNTGAELIRAYLEKLSVLVKGVKLAIALLPDEKKIKYTVEVWADLTVKKVKTPMGKERFQVKEECGSVYLLDRDNLMAEKMEGENSDCYFYIGILQYLSEWSTGKKYDIVQTRSKARGEEFDEYRISKLQA